MSVLKGGLQFGWYFIENDVTRGEINSLLQAKGECVDQLYGNSFISCWDILARREKK